MVIRPVHSAADLDAVYRLVHDAYVAAGYAEPTADGRLRYSAELDAAPETVVLVAESGDRLIGTISMTLDGPAGLHVDRHFADACARVRAEGGRLACIWRLATAAAVRGRQRVVLDLVHSATHVLDRLGVATSLSEFHPRHEHAYHRLFGMTTVARAAWIGDVRSPGILMRGDIRANAADLSLAPNPALATLVVERQRLLRVLRVA